MPVAQPDLIVSPEGGGGRCWLESRSGAHALFG